MKTLGSVLVAAVWLAATPALAVEQIRVFLVGGQSNADGRADKSGLPTSPVNLQLPQSDVAMWSRDGKDNVGTFVGWTSLAPGFSYSPGVYGTSFGPEVTLGYFLNDYRANVLHDSNLSIAIIKSAFGGTNLYSQWKAGGTGTTSGDGATYVSFQNHVNAGLTALKNANPGKSIALAGMIWVQGESDLNSSGADAYGANLKAFINDVRLTFPTYGSGSMPFFYSRLSDNQTAYSSNAYLGTVRAQQGTVVNSGSANYVADASMLNIDGAEFSVKSDNIHFDANGQYALGHAFADSAIAANTLPEPGTLILLLAGACWCGRKLRWAARACPPTGRGNS